jgi:arylsulfatase A-like enzyme
MTFSFPLPSFPRTASAALVLLIWASGVQAQTTQPTADAAAGTTARTYAPMTEGKTALPARPNDRPIPAVTHVVIISIDGCRPDLLLRGDTPVMHAMLDRGTFTFWARTTAESITLPSHTSMVTGVQPTKHGIQWNADLPLERPVYPAYPTLFQLAHKAGYSTAMAAGKSKFIALAVPGSIDYLFLPQPAKPAPISDATTRPVRPEVPDGPVDAAALDKADGGEPNRTGKVDGVDNNDDVTDAAVAMELQHQPGILYVHLPSTDNMGHKYGWASPRYMAALHDADTCIGRILAAVDQVGLTGHTFVLVTADHGGAGRGHGPDDPRSRHIPWIATGPGVRRGLDLTTYGDLQVDTEDTFATACYLLGIPIVKKVEGKPITQIVERTELLR